MIKAYNKIIPNNSFLPKNKKKKKDKENIFLKNKSKKS